MTRFKLGYVCGDYGLIDNEKDNWTDFHSMSENSEKNVQICIRKMNELANENENNKKLIKCAYDDNDRLRNKNKRLHKDWDKIYELCRERFTDEEIITELSR